MHNIKNVFFIGLFFVANLAHPQTLCTEKESIIFSFQEQKSKKILSLCKGMEPSYLVYRFGLTGKIELQYPSMLDSSSWEKFRFFGRRRAGGKANEGYGEYSLSFPNGNTEYTVFQEWDDVQGSYSLGVNIQRNGKSISLHGNEKSQHGSLVLLESEGDNIPNTADQ